MITENDKKQSSARTLAIALFVGCAGWLILVAMLRLTTARPVPIVNIRWAKHASVEQRKSLARDLSLVLDEPKGGDTAAYFVLDAGASNLMRIVVNPLVEDTAYIDRNAYTLVNPPTGQMWIGSRYPALKFPGLIYLCLTVCIISGVALELRARRPLEPFSW
jgi:hypothetical protein